MRPRSRAPPPARLSVYRLLIPLAGLLVFAPSCRPVSPLHCVLVQRARGGDLIGRSTVGAPKASRVGGKGNFLFGCLYVCVCFFFTSNATDKGCQRPTQRQIGYRLSRRVCVCRGRERVRQFGCEVRASGGSGRVAAVPRRDWQQRRRRQSVCRSVSLSVGRSVGGAELTGRRDWLASRRGFGCSSGVASWRVGPDFA
ncbi:unnamed protein product [Protopolystoma xenopodis]|uniref:Secreted protein n=1 Tax=Protopolystoma xenopodis TaxID=117903 RepID=A0A3S5AN13_9PLAT|nr:unnamed protein product [Protopolystoma xenopodis]